MTTETEGSLGVAETLVATILASAALTCLLRAAAIRGVPVRSPNQGEMAGVDLTASEAPAPTAPLVSVCVTSFNYARFVAAAIDSALSQSYPRIEVIVVDDGSTDDSRTIIEGYGARVKPVFKSNGGQASAANAAFANANGDIVLFLNSDDMLLESTVERVVEAFSATPGLAMAQFRLEIVDEDGRRTGFVKPPLEWPMPSGDLRAHALRFRNYIWPPDTGHAYSQAALNSVMPIPEDDYRLNSDHYLASAIPLCGPIQSLDEVGARYREHGANFHLSASLKEYVSDSIRVICREHEHLRRLAPRLGIRAYPAEVGAPLDWAFEAYRLTSLKLWPEDHPLPGDRALRLTARGILAVLMHPHYPLGKKLKRSAWFVAMALGPRGAAERLGRRLYLPGAAG